MSLASHDQDDDSHRLSHLSNRQMNSVPPIQLQHTGAVDHPDILTSSTVSSPPTLRQRSRSATTTTRTTPTTHDESLLFSTPSTWLGWKKRPRPTQPLPSGHYHSTPTALSPAVEVCHALVDTDSSSPIWGSKNRSSAIHFHDQHHQMHQQGNDTDDCSVLRPQSLWQRRRESRQATTAKRRRWLIPAEHPLKIAWDVITFILSVFQAYAKHCSIHNRQFGSTAFTRFCELWFVLDILFNFVTEHKTSQGVVLRRANRVWAHYLTTWFVIDVISLFPGESLYIQPLIEQQNRRGFFQKYFFRTRAVIRVSRFLRGHHVQWFTVAARHSKRVGLGGASQLLRHLIYYVPKYWLFIRNMKAVIVIRLLRQVHWFTKIYRRFVPIKTKPMNHPITGTMTKTMGSHNIASTTTTGITNPRIACQRHEINPTTHNNTNNNNTRRKWFWNWILFFPLEISNWHWFSLEYGGSGHQKRQQHYSTNVAVVGVRNKDHDGTTIDSSKTENDEDDPDDDDDETQSLTEGEDEWHSTDRSYLDDDDDDDEEEYPPHTEECGDDDGKEDDDDDDDDLLLLLQDMNQQDDSREETDGWEYFEDDEEDDDNDNDEEDDDDGPF